MRRVVAVVAAVAMVAGAFAIRSRLDRKDEERSASLRLACSVELEAPCRALGAADARIQLTVEPAGTTADRLAAASDDPGLDGWLVSGPWPEIVDGRRQARALPALFGPDRPTLARSPLVLVVWRDRERALTASRRCGEAVGWKCLGEAAGAGPWTASGGSPEWGPVKPGHGDPDIDAVGLLVLGQAVAGWFDRTDLSTFDLDDDAFAAWFSALERAVPPSGTSPLDLMLSFGPARYDATGTTEAQAAPLVAASARGRDLGLLYPSPMATADVTLATIGAGPAPSSLRRLATGEVAKRELAQAGWRVPGEKTVQGVDANRALPPTSGLPPPGLLDALRERFRQVARR